MLVAIGEALDTPVSTLLGETVPASEPEGLQALSEKLEVLNDQFARARESKRRALHALCIAIAAALLHGFEWIFARMAPIILAGSIAGAVASRK